MNRDYLCVKEVCQILPFSEKWVYVHKEEIPGYFKLANSILFDKEILLKSLKKLATDSKPIKKRNGGNNRHNL